jgi:GR25 family glycosyltransferase involved in LPS biosynthesis
MEVFILGLEDGFRGGPLLDYFKDLSIVPTVVFGIDGRVSSSELTSYKASRNRMSLIMNRQLAPAEVAIVLGHRLIYEKFLETSSEWAIVLEEDSLPTQNFDLSSIELINLSEPTIVNMAGIESLVRDCDVFPCLMLQPENISSSDEEFIVYYTLGNTFGAWAYLVNRRAAEVAIENFNSVDSTADWPYSWRTKVRFARPEKCFFSVSLDGSKADEGRKSELELTRKSIRLWCGSRSLQRFRTLLGILGVLSFAARVRGEDFRQHYLEKVAIPFLLRRFK